MNSRFLKGMVVTAAIVLSGLSGPAWAGGSDDLGCSNATLKGAYAFGVTNYAFALVVTGIEIFDGNGKFTRVITPATAFQRSSHRRGGRTAPTRLIPTAQGARCST